MKNQISNIALEGTCSGDVVGGLIILDRGKPSGAFVFERGNHRPEKERAAQEEG